MNLTYTIVKVIIQSQNMIFVGRIVLVDKLEKLYLIKALVKKIFVVFYNLHTDIHASVEVMCLYSFAESSRSKILSHVITSSYDRIQDNVKIFILFEASSEKQTEVQVQ